MPALGLPRLKVISVPQSAVIIPDRSHVEQTIPILVQVGTKNVSVYIPSQLDEQMMVNKGVNIDKLDIRPISLCERILKIVEIVP
jgi:sporulation-control protein spo0M